MDLTFTLPLALLALSIEAAFGYPQALLRRVGHPVVWIGALIDFFDRRLNKERDSFELRRRKGTIALVILLTIVIFITAFITRFAGNGFPGLIILSVLAASLPAQRSLASHIRAVADALDVSLDVGRDAVAHVVGRDVAALDHAGVARAAIESLSENFSDGIVAPIFWTALFGLPGGAAYKAVNTADSMIGHRTPRHEAFGWAAARLDDLVNWPAVAHRRRADHRRRLRDARRRCQCRAPRRGTRCEKPCLAECRLAGSGHGWRTRPATRRPPHLQWCDD